LGPTASSKLPTTSPRRMPSSHVQLLIPRGAIWRRPGRGSLRDPRGRCGCRRRIDRMLETDPKEQARPRPTPSAQARRQSHPVPARVSPPTTHRIPSQGREDLQPRDVGATDRPPARAARRPEFLYPTGYRDDFFLKLAAASRLGRSELKRVLRTQREAYLSELAALAQLQSDHRDDPLVSLLIEAATLHTEANLKILDRAETAAAQPAPRRRGASADRSEPRARRAAS
jgi:hypothetical protein